MKHTRTQAQLRIVQYNMEVSIHVQIQKNVFERKKNWTGAYLMDTYYVLCRHLPNIIKHFKQ